MRAALLAGLGFGFLIGAQVGPVWLLCARSSLRRGARIGLSVGAGAAVIDLAYAALGVAGAARLLTVSSAWDRSRPHRTPLTIASWAAIFAAASVGDLASDTTTTLLLLAFGGLLG